MISKTGTTSESTSANAAPEIARRQDGATRTEAHATLLSLADDWTGALPPEVLADHVMAITEGADWPVRRAALAAVLRRFESARSEDLRVAARPSGGDPIGVYATRRKGQAQRPYSTVLSSVSPLRGSCDCRDFLRNSLGCCKHIAAVLEAIASAPRTFKRALAPGPRSTAPHAARLTWNPVRPFVGEGDWLAGVRLEGASEKSPKKSQLRGNAWAKALARFDSRGVGPSALRNTFSTDPAKRLALVRDLLGVARPGRNTHAFRDPALAALLLREARDLESRPSSASTERALAQELRGLKRPLYPYQREGVRRFLEQGSLLLGDDMGLGKTAQATAICHVLWHRQSGRGRNTKGGAARVRKGLLLVPNSLKPQWIREWRQFTDVPIELVEGSPSQREEIYRRAKTGFLVANYEQIWRDLDLMREFAPDIVILDEAQRIKNWATKTALCVKTLSPRYRLVLTGTPMENRIDEIASIMDWIDDMALEPKWRLAPWHSTYADGSREVIGARNLATLRTRLAPRMLRRLRSEVLDQLPPRTDTTVPVEMTAAQGEEHDALRQPIARIMSISERRPLFQAEFLRLMQLFTTQRIICNGLAQLHFESVWPGLQDGRKDTSSQLTSLDSPKLVELREILNQVAVEQGRKVVVFSQWRRMLRLAHWSVRDLLEAHGLRAAFFTGMESSRQRTRNVVDFHDDPNTRVLFCTDAGGVGLNLQKAANCCVNLELPWNPAVLEQRVGRIHRIGQKDPIDVYDIVTTDGIESRIAALVADKRALSEGLFDGTCDEVRFAGSASFLARLKKVVGDSPAAGASMRTHDVPDDVPDDDDAVANDERQLDAVLEEADETRDSRSLVETPVAAPTDGLRDLLKTLRIESTRNGSIRIEAPAETAGALASLFEGVANMLRNQERAEDRAP